jgi:predicted PurR-regulated permease PerM
MRDHLASTERTGHFSGDRSHPAAVVSVASFAIIVAGLYFAREILIPIALAVLLSFVLSPLVNILRRRGLGRVPAVAMAIAVALMLVLAIASLIAGQLASLVEEAGRYEVTVQHKIAAADDATFGRLPALLGSIGEHLLPASRQAPPPSGGAEKPATPSNPKPVPVEVQQPEHSALELARSILTPVVSPLATLFVTFIFAIFILLQREDLRDRLMRLFGSVDLHRMTLAMDDAADRLSRYFLALLGVNAAFGTSIAVGLALIGVPSPVLWGVVGLLLRFVPYIGAVLSAAPPLALAAAIDPGWGPFLWTAALFLGVEIVLSQAVEPFLYGHSTGLSPVSVVIAATFWTWLWGPIGLILSTPITLCLVVLGRHVDRLHFLDIALGDRPALTPIESFYQRMLAGAPHEARDQAREFLKEQSLTAYYDEAVIGGMRLAATDLARRVLDREHFDRIRKALEILIEDLGARKNLDKGAEPEGARERAGASGGSASRQGAQSTGSNGSAATRDQAVGEASPARVLCVAGRGSFDWAVAAIAAQLLGKRGFAVDVAPYVATSRLKVETLDLDGVAAICVLFLEVRERARHIRETLARLKQRAPHTPLIVGLVNDDDGQLIDSEELREALDADHLVSSLEELLQTCRDIMPRAPERTAASRSKEEKQGAEPVLSEVVK